MTRQRGRVTVVGLGPGDPGLVTAATLDAIEATSVRRLRTAVHPSASLMGEAPSFDHHYEEADTFGQVYERITADLVALAAEHAEVLYAVPGSPTVLEHTVELLTRAAERDEIDLRILPAVSFVELAWSRLGIDPFEDGATLIDGHRFEDQAIDHRGPMLIAHCHNRRVLSDIKLAVDDPPRQPVTVLQRLGLPDEEIRTVAWADLDREFEPDHLTALFVPALDGPVGSDGTEVPALVEIVETLRAECPWDARQTHASLSAHLVEETYEVIEALEAVGEGGPGTDPTAYADLEEELGDLLFQIVFHAVLATEAGAFDLGDVARGIHDKLRHRHPHVFPRDGVLGDVTVDDAEAVARNWERIKKDEKGRASVFDGIPYALPALARAAKVLKKAASLDLDPAAILPPTEAGTDAAVVDEESLARLLLTGVAAARRIDVDPEAALRRATDALITRIRALESPPT